MVKFDTDKPILDRDKRPQREPEIGMDGNVVWMDEESQIPKTRIITHGMVAVRAIDQVVEDEDRKLPRDVIKKRNKFCDKLMDGGVHELADDEARLICQRVNMFGLMIAAQIQDAIDPEGKFE